MPAQLIVVPTLAETPEAKSKKSAEEKRRSMKGKAAGSEKAKKAHRDYVPAPVQYIPTPVVYRAAPGGAINVFGQKPVRMGHFSDVATLLDKVQARKQLPGKSNTLFASVAKLDDLQLSSVHSKLQKLPEQLTIVVHEGKRRG